MKKEVILILVTILLAGYAARGITPDNMIFTKEERDANPCTFGGEPADTWVSLG